jgi:carbon storage regulator
MLVLSRKANESIVIDEGIEVTVLDIRGDKVRLGFVTPREMPIHRREVWEAIERVSRIGRRQMVVPLGELEVPRGKPNRQLISDYTFWLWS